MNEIEPIKIELLSQIISCMLSGSRMATNVSIFNNKDNGKYADSYIIYVSGKISLLIMGIGYNALSLPAFLAVYPPKEPVNIEEKRAAMLLWMNQVEAEFLTEEIEAARRVILQHLPTNIEEQHTDYIEKLQNPASYDANLLEKPEFSTMLSDFIEVVNEQKSSSSVSSVGMFRQAPEIEAVQDIQNTQQNVVRPSGCCVIS